MRTLQHSYNALSLIEGSSSVGMLGFLCDMIMKRGLHDRCRSARQLDLNHRLRCCADWTACGGVCMHFCHRMQVLETQGLGLEASENREAAWQAADTLIALCHKENPLEASQNQPRSIGVSQLDQFWFSCQKSKHWDITCSCPVLCGPSCSVKCLRCCCCCCIDQVCCRHEDQLVTLGSFSKVCMSPAVMAGCPTMWLQPLCQDACILWPCV